MRKLLATAALVALGVTTTFVALGANSAAAQDQVVRIYNWSDYIDESVLEEFTAKTGIEVVYDTFDSNEVLETKLLAGGTGYDIVVPTGTFLQRQIQAGVFQPLDKSKLTNLENLWLPITERIAGFDPGNAHAINYMWGTTGIGYNVDAVIERLGVETVTSWDVIFDPETIAKFADCGVHVLDSPTELFPAALNYLGYDGDSHDLGEIEEAAALLASIRPHVQQFHSSSYINELANGNICLAVGWSGDVLQARDRAIEADNGVRVEYAIPEEGALMWFDNMAIPSDAPNPEAAHAFLDFIMGAEAIAKASNYVYYANGNFASQQYLNDDVIGDPAIYPTQETVQNLYVTTPYPPRVQRTVTRAWTRVKTGS
ncbi:MAG: polyamine ABC transporter substrate-binding protein [Pseudomonadota bacterium]